MRRFVISALAGLAVLLGAGAAIGSQPALAADASAVARGAVALGPDRGAPKPLMPVGVGGFKASVDDFYFQSFDADYHLGRNDPGNSTLRTVETIVAVFPDIDQNRGIQRAIPNKYDGHPVDVQILSVTDETGAHRSYDAEEGDDGDFTVLTIAAHDYVHGAQTYVIEYLQTNVTLEPDNATVASANEFYWDVNGSGWAQSFDSVTARVHLDADLAAAFTGNTACYQGYSGTRDPCEELTESDSGDGLLIIARATDLKAKQNLTIALGFQDGTFVPRDNSYFASPAAIGQLVLFGVLLATTLFALFKRRTMWRDDPGRGTIIPEYLPPKQITPLFASTVYGKSGKATAAEFLNLAVNHNVRVIEEPSFSGRGRPKFQFEYVTDAGLDEQGVELVTAMFGAERTPGDRKNMSKPDTRLGRAMQELMTKAKELALTLGYRRKAAVGTRVWIFLFAAATTVLSVIFGAVLADNDRGVPVAVLLIVAAVAVFIVLIGLVVGVRPLTAFGAELRDYLKGLEVYIRLAETDRMRVLQSPGGAVRTPFRPIGETPWSAPATSPTSTQVETGQIVKLYERLLPYAVLFGLEKQWSEQLGAAYDTTGTRPDWYHGSSGFNTAVFVAGVGALSSTVSRTWSGSASSSSSSGSGGGGFSGGGGGGSV